MPVPGTKTAAAMALRRRRVARTAQAGYAPRRTFNPPVGLWIAGIDYTSYLIVDSPNIRNTAYPQTGVFSFRLEAAGASLANVKAEQEVTFNKSGVTYAGVVRTITPTDLRPAPGLGLDVECQDYTSLLKDEICTSTRSVIETDQQRISWLLQVFDRRGLTAYNVQSLFSSLPPQDFTGVALEDAIKAVLAFSNAKFYVDAAKDLHTFISETSTAPFGLSDAPDGTTTFGFGDFTYPTDSVDLRNAVYVTGQPGIPNAAASAIVSNGSLLMGNPEGAIATFKPSVSSVPVALVGEGSVAVGSNVSVSPAFKQPTTAGNLLVAWVVGFGALPTTTGAGWQRASPPAGPPYTSLWFRPNCGASEAAPVFTSAGTQPMFAQLAEFSGVSTTAALDRTGSAGPPAPGSLFSSLAVTTSAADTAAGDLILVAETDFSLYFYSPVPNEPVNIFKEVINNATSRHIGDAQSWNTGSGTTFYSGFAYAIVLATPTWYTDEASIALYGRREASFSNNVVGTQAALDALGAAYLAEHANPLRHGTLTCRQVGLSPGMTVPITNALYGLSSQAFRIQGIQTTFSDNVPQFAVEFASARVDLATQMGDLQSQISENAVKTQGSVSAYTLGTLGYAEVTANQTPITAAVDLTGLTVTITVAAGRRIRITGNVLLGSSIAGDTAWVGIFEGAVQLRTAQVACATTAGAYAALVTVELAPSAGTHTYKLRAQRLAGTGNVTMNAASTDPASLLVEDVGT